MDRLAQIRAAEITVRRASAAPCREIQPQSLVRLVDWKMTLKETRATDALLEVR